MKKLYMAWVAMLCACFTFAQSAQVQIIHNSPSPTVDIYADGALFEDDFAFRTATPFQTLPAGVELNIGVALGTSTSVADTLVNFPVTFENGKTYVVIANGIVGNEETPFTLAVTDMAQEASTDAGAVQIMAFHGSPGAPAVDINNFGGPDLISGLAYGGFTEGYLGLPGGPHFQMVRWCLSRR